MPKISIIVPVYKVEALLDRCVNSIRNQSFGDFELLLVDDGSPDSCGLMCEEYARLDSRIQVFHKENGGQGSARNLALDWAVSNSDSQWITFIDSDDWIHRDYLRLLLETAEKENVEVSMCDYLTTDRVQQDAPADDAQIIRMDAETAIVDYYYLCTAPWGKLYAKRFFTTLRFPEIRAYEDAFITHLPVYEAGTVAFYPEKLYYYYENQTSTTRKKWSTRNLSQIEAHEVRLAYCKEHGYDRAYGKELEHYVIACFAQATAMNQAVKEDRGVKVHLQALRPKLLPLLRHARSFGLFPFNQKYLWIYEIAYPVKPVWVLRNILEAKLGLKFPR